MKGDLKLLLKIIIYCGAATAIFAIALLAFIFIVGGDIPPTPPE